ncbi:MAG: hypothetical protein QM711_01085 [Micropruina sp.]|uniref:hypothetical protein n=1 Tax=Micropruina sp. TaxID=2737536 RepID=UPI0039E5983E
MTTAPASTSVQRVRSATIGAVLSVTGTAQFFIAHVVAESAWTLPAYSWRDNYIGDLGATVCGPVLHDVCSPLHSG